MLFLVMGQTLPSKNWKQKYLVLSDDISLHNIKLYIIGDLSTENPQKVIDDYCAFLVLDGYGNYEDETGFRRELKPGSYVQHIPGRHHIIHRRPDKPWMELSFRFSEDLARWHIGNHIITVEPPVRQIAAWHSRAGSFFDLMDKAQKGAITFPETLATLILWAARMEEEPEDLQVRVRNILDSYLPADKSEKVLLSSLDYSYDYLRHLFHQNSGMTLRAYREKRRLEEAATMIASNGMTVAAAADLFGYSDQFVFSRAFKRVLGYPPGRVREVRI